MLQLTQTELNHLLVLLHDAEEVGDYYGNKEHYWKRHHRIVEKLQNYRVETAKDDGK